jgi:hypothetical protein
MRQPNASRGLFSLAGVAPGPLFICGAFLFPAFLLQQDIIVRALQIALFIGLNAFSGRRIRVLQYLVVIAGIVIFNLVVPTGKVLANVVGLPITEGALRTGLLKATAMAGLIALSQFSIRGNLKLPGRLGGLLGRSLFYFEKIMGERRRIDRKDVLGSIDRLLLEIQAAGAPQEDVAAGQDRFSPPAAVALAVIVLLNWGALAMTLVHPRFFWGW